MPNTTSDVDQPNLQNTAPVSSSMPALPGSTARISISGSYIYQILHQKEKKCHVVSSHRGRNSREPMRDDHRIGRMRPHAAARSAILPLHPHHDVQEGITPPSHSTTAYRTHAETLLARAHLRSRPPCRLVISKVHAGGMRTPRFASPTEPPWDARGGLGTGVFKTPSRQVQRSDSSSSSTSAEPTQTT